jgi:hypothetical protein
VTDTLLAPLLLSLLLLLLPSFPCSFISNLDYKVTDEDIQELFGTVGTIKDSGIHYDKRCGFFTGCCMMCGFVLHTVG